MPNPADENLEESRRGMLYGALAYGSWGVLPIFFRALEPAGPLEILAQRILWSSLFCMLIWIWKRDLGWLWNLLRDGRKVLTLAVAAYVLAINWGVYIYAVSIGNVLESSLGYFVNPLILVLVGVIVLHERMNRMQWAAIGLGTVAVLIITADYGRLPWIALSLAISFTIYGFIKKRVGAGIGALQTMTVESLLLMPLAIGMLIWVRTHDNNLTFLGEGAMHTFLLMMLGIATMLPLSWFTAAATRLPLTTMGLLQFLAPIGQFLTGVFIFHESVPAARWLGFGFVWAALAMLTVDMFRTASRNRRRRREAVLA